MLMNILLRPILCYPAFMLCVIALLLQNTIFKYHEWHWDSVVRYVSMAVLYSYVLTWLVWYGKNKVLKIVFYSFLLLVCLVNFFLYFHFKSSISPNMLLLIAETNANEAAEFFSMYIFSFRTFWSFCLLFVAIGMILVVERYELLLSKWISGHRRLSMALRWLIILLLTMGLIAHGSYLSLLQCRSTVDVDEWVTEKHAVPMDNISNLFFCVYDLNLAREEQSLAVEATKKYVNLMDMLDNSDSIDVVVVIGESYIKWHSELYGYGLHTTPYMKKEQEEGNLYAFTDVLAPFNTTSKVLRNVFSCNSLGYQENWFDYPFFPALFKRAGYRVLFWDNQYDSSSRESFDFSLNSYLHNPDISSISYDAVNERTYDLDGDMLQSFWKSYMKTRGVHTLSILHMMGQHIAYYNRFPHKAPYHHFTKDSILRHEPWMTDEKRQLIADYDNATYYNDAVLKRIFDFYRQRNAIVVYFSDHGEEVYDYQNHAGRRHEKLVDGNLLKYQYEVPFIIWCSDSFIKTHENLVSSVRKSLNCPLSLDNVCQLLFHLGAVRTPAYHPDRDIISSSYQCPPRIVNDRRVH